MDVYVVTYTHKHGADVKVCASEALATRAAAQMAVDNADDATDDAAEVSRMEGLLADGHYADALAAWRAAWAASESAFYNETESIAIECMPLIEE